MTVEGKNNDPSTQTPSTQTSGESRPVALDVIRPNMSPVERRRRRRMLLQSMLITFFLTFSWIGALIAIQVMSGTSYNFDDETRQVLERIRDGQAELVYQQASPLLQETMILDRFLERASDIRTTLGGFRDLLAIKRVESISGPGGETARARATIEFDRARTLATFSYHYHDGSWRLLGFNIHIPEELGKEAASKAETKAVRIEAPTEVYKLTQALLDLMRDGKSGEVYDASAETFKLSIDRDTFIENQIQRRRILGGYVRVLDIMSATRNKSRNSAKISMLVEYEKTKTTVVIGFRKRDEVWQLSYYKVEIPLPKIPTSTPERPPER